MRHGRRRINPLYLGSKGEEGIKDIATILSLTGAVNRSRGQQSRSRFGRRKHKFNFEHTEWRCWLGVHERSTGLLETGDYSAAERPSLEMKILSHLCLKDKANKEARGRAYQRLQGFRRGLLDAKFWLLTSLFHLLFLTIFGMPLKWFADEWIIALYMQIHKIYSKVMQ